MTNLLVVRATGLEPAQESPLEPKSNASANSATPAKIVGKSFSNCLLPHFPTALLS